MRPYTSSMAVVSIADGMTSRSVRSPHYITGRRKRLCNSASDIQGGPKIKLLTN